MITTTNKQPFAAKAHLRAEYQYSNFHKSLLHENSRDNYALRHIYSLENTKALLKTWGWTPEQIAAGIDYATIDVYEKVVWLHIPNKINKRNEAIKIRGISRFISKADCVDTLVKRAWEKADPYKLQPGSDWNELLVIGNTGEFYELTLTEERITCTCHAHSGVEKAFWQDKHALKMLIEHPTAQGQIPDKHCFAVWKYLQADNQRQYEHSFHNRQEAYLEEQLRQSRWDFDPPEEIEEELATW